VAVKERHDGVSQRISELERPGSAGTLGRRQLTGFDTPSDIAGFYLDRGARQVVVKLGPTGAYYSGVDGFGSVPARAVADVVYTVGAGDGFTTGVISALLEGLPLHAAVVRGNLIGARVIQFRGDMDGLPTRSELTELAASLAC
jgi:sugar/nucleoside kinase (ribokinase family)